LAGTFEIGLQGKDDAEWAIKFNALIFDSFMFATGNFKDWLIGPKAIFTTQGNTRRSISSSSISSIPMELFIYNLPNITTHPTFAVEDIPWASSNV